MFDRYYFHIIFFRLYGLFESDNNVLNDAFSKGIVINETKNNIMLFTYNKTL